MFVVANNNTNAHTLTLTRGRARRAQLSGSCVFVVVGFPLHSRERVRTRYANERPNLSAVGQQLKATKLSCGLWAMRSTKSDGSAAKVVVVEEKAKMEWRESAERRKVAG